METQWTLPQPDHYQVAPERRLKVKRWLVVREQQMKVNVSSTFLTYVFYLLFVQIFFDFFLPVFFLLLVYGVFMYLKFSCFSLAPFGRRLLQTWCRKIFVHVKWCVKCVKCNFVFDVNNITSLRFSSVFIGNAIQLTAILLNSFLKAPQQLD